MFDHWTELRRKSQLHDNLRLYSKSSLTLNEWRFNLIYLCRSLPFLSILCRASSHILGYDPPAVQKKQWHSRKAQIEPVFFECERALLIRASVLTTSQYSLWEYIGGNPRFTSERWLASFPQWQTNLRSQRALHEWHLTWQLYANEMPYSSFHCANSCFKWNSLVFVVL